MHSKGKQKRKSRRSWKHSEEERIVSWFDFQDGDHKFANWIRYDNGPTRAVLKFMKANPDLRASLDLTRAKFKRMYIKYMQTRDWRLSLGEDVEDDDQYRGAGGQEITVKQETKRRCWWYYRFEISRESSRGSNDTEHEMNDESTDKESTDKESTDRASEEDSADEESEDPPLDVASAIIFAEKLRSSQAHEELRAKKREWDEARQERQREWDKARQDQQREWDRARQDQLREWAEARREREAQRRAEAEARRLQHEEIMMVLHHQHAPTQVRNPNDILYQ